jgi:hypothetical protein
MVSRDDKQEEEVHALLAELRAAGNDPGWEPTPRREAKDR